MLQQYYVSFGMMSCVNVPSGVMCGSDMKCMVYCNIACIEPCSDAVTNTETYYIRISSTIRSYTALILEIQHIQCIRYCGAGLARYTLMYACTYVHTYVLHSALDWN